MPAARTPHPFDDPYHHDSEAPGFLSRYTQEQRLAFLFYFLDLLIGVPFLALILMRQIHWNMKMEDYGFLHGSIDAWLPWAVVTILTGLFRTGLSVWRPDVFGQRAMTSISLFYGLCTIIMGMIFTGLWAQIHGGIGCMGEELHSRPRTNVTVIAPAPTMTNMTMGR